MKKIIVFFLITICTVLYSCKKDTNGVVLPWKFTLKDSISNYSNLIYSFDAQTYSNDYNRDYPYYQSQGNADSIFFSMSSDFTCYLNKTSPLNLNINFSALDSIVARRLLKTNSLVTKQNALKDIFLKDKVYKIARTAPATGFICNYTAENKITYGTNVFNSVAGDYVKITSSQLWEDGSGLAKIKVWLNYDLHLQSHNNATWLSEIKHITGTMQTFFAVEY